MKTKLLSVFAISLVAGGVLVGCKSKSTDPEVFVPEGMTTLCGSSQIVGTKEASFSKGSCGITDPVKVHYVNGVKLSAPALINCKTATTLSGWMSNSVQPAARAELGKSVTDMYVMASYSCRTRNHVPGAKLSEHSFGNAIDIGGFTFDDDTKMTLLDQYYSDYYNKFMTTIRAGACGPFGTILGPGTNAAHRNHFHFDVASYSMGAYCR